MAQQFQFDLSGGNLCLDFANTSASWKAGGTQVERLHSYSDLLAFSTQSGLLTAAEVRALGTFAAGHPSRVRRIFSEAKLLREAIYRVFSAIATGSPVPQQYLDALNSAYASAIEHGRMVQDENAFRREWRAESEMLERPLWPIAAAANDLLTSSATSQLRECPSDDCSWLFLDQSRNQSRRWCDMKTCGNRAKARRHYERVSS